ncbi:CAMKK/CAMKK-META protein kinase [Polytolypa hystricis UAMH7299]|uniref:CAMKK/CAMKK-META protein kinase n=1 Tax=Polytolypa hystricis (strain UAMH7299) TaxID=1447883 RepID=A0A2B7WJ22_POLH7|nr:CAMKK/CAMKK-META protein kinase [Polytolypa hystricis UAMH7299]
MAFDVIPTETQQSAGHALSRINTTTECKRSEPQQRRANRSSYDSPLRHHARNHTAPRRVKETLNARSEYTNSQDDGVAEHRINQYLIKQEIGRGSFGAVHLATDQYGNEFAVKEFSKSRLRKRAKSHVLRNPRGSRPRPGVVPAGSGFNSPLHRHPSATDEEEGNSLYLIKEEIAIMKKLHHNNLVALIEVLDDPTEDSLYMVMEMCKKGVIMKVGLDEEADPYDDESCRCWFRDLILGIEYLHAQGIVHRDIKPDNCLLTSDDVLKIVDFGVSEMFEKDSEMYTAKSAGSPAFFPPELCVVRHGDVSGRAADIWSMGVTLYCLRYGRIPFPKESILEMYEAIRSDDINLDDETDEEFKDLMRQILEKDPAKRIDMTELRNHPWVTKGGSDPLLSAEENTADLVSPPTEEEMESAITKNMGNLMAVVKAVRKFKKLINPAGAEPVSILGQDVESNFVQPPLMMEEEERPDFGRRPIRQYPRRRLAAGRQIQAIAGAGAEEANAEITELKPQSSERDGAITSATGTTRSSISRLADSRLLPQLDTVNANVSTSSTPPSQGSRADTPSKQSFTEGTRGHARDPLEEHLYLYIGPSTFSGVPGDHGYVPPDYLSAHAVTDPGVADAENEFSSPFPVDQVPIVSESPGAAEIDIYETAYKEEIERITKRSLELHSPVPRVYLTRRVESKKSSLSALLQRAAESHKLSPASQNSPERDWSQGQKVASDGNQQDTSSDTVVTPAAAGVDSSDNSSSETSSVLAARRASIAERATSTATTTTATATATAEVTTSLPAGGKQIGGLRSLLDLARKNSL